MTNKLVSSYSDIDDAETCLRLVGIHLTRCAGGRLLAVGFDCPHCDSAHPDLICKAPATTEPEIVKKSRLAEPA